MNPYPLRVPGIVSRAVRLGWEVTLSRPSATEVELYLREPDGAGYDFTLRWERDQGCWRAPRSQNTETVVEYLTRAEKERTS